MGAPMRALPLAVAPIAPDPFVPDGSVLVKLAMVIDATTVCDRLARTLTPDSTLGANARQISDVPI